MKAVIWMLCSPVLLLTRTEGASITNYFGGSSDWPLHSLTINAGDTVVWVNQMLGGNYVESFGGEWKSPLMNTGDSFSFTFTNAGFFAYRTGSPQKPPTTAGTEATAGTVIVNAWAGAPPAVTITVPVQGDVNQTWLQASVTNEQNIAEIQYFANSTLIGSATNPPYVFAGWNPGIVPRTPYVLMARAIDRQGAETWSQPVNVFIEREYDLWGARVLPTGEVLFYYNASPWFDFIAASDSVLFTNQTQLAGLAIHGVFVDETVRGEAVPRRFYKIAPGLP